MQSTLLIPDPTLELGRPIRVDLRKSRTRWTMEYKLKRAAWNAARVLLFRPTPRRLGNKWRLWLLRRFGAIIHGNPIIYASCKILQPWCLEIGDGSMIGNDVEIYNYALVSIGSMSVVSQYSYLCTGTHDYTHPHFPLTWAPITIGSECWIAAGVYIAPGINIGSGTVVGARSTVTRNMPEWSVCAGHPCRVLKPRIIKEENL